MIVLYAALALPALTAVLPRWTWTMAAGRGWTVAPPSAAAMAGLLMAYAAGALILLARLGAGRRRVARLRATADPLFAERPLALLRARAAAIGLENPPDLATTNVLRVPVTTGVQRPVILLPADWEAWPEATLAAVLAHELAHVARGDALAQQCALLYRALFWFNPLGWWLCLRLADLAEQAGDEAAMAAGAVREDYAEALLGFFAALARTPRRARWQALAMAGGGGAERRVRRILTWQGAASLRLAESLTLAMALAAAPGILAAAVLHPVWVSPAAPAAAARKPPAVAVAPSAPAPTPAPKPAAPAPTAAAPQVDAEPFELVTSGVRTLVTPEERTGALALLDRARENGLAALSGGAPFEVRARLSATGADEVLGGSGTFDEKASPNGKGSWSATLGATSVDRVHAGGHIWSSQAQAAVPMRIQAAHSLLMSRLQTVGLNFSLRAADISWRGTRLGCVLISRETLVAAGAGRNWEEKEFCVNPANGLLVVSSQSPGSYAVFDYSGRRTFHGRPVPSGIAVWQDGTRALTISDIEVADWPDADAAPPTPAMLAQGPSFGLLAPGNMYWPAAPGADAQPPVTIHCTLDQSGAILESEPLQTGDPVRTAIVLDQVRKTRFGQLRGMQRDLYIHVER